MSNFYISGALTGTDETHKLREFYETIAELCRRFGHTAYLPHENTDPIIHPKVSPREVYEKDREEVSKADILLAYVGIPSLGVGTEIEFAREFRIPVILLLEKSKPVSRIARGNPAVIKEIVFSDFDHAINELKEFLEFYLPKIFRTERINRNGKSA